VTQIRLRGIMVSTDGNLVSTSTASTSVGALFYIIQPSSRALSLAAFRARARNSARAIGPFC
jgi:hypothetical protein